jgi:hypothetical protein
MFNMILKSLLLASCIYAKTERGTRKQFTFTMKKRRQNFF